MKYIYSILIFIPIVLLGFSSCNKEKFPQDKNLLGHWIEKSNVSPKAELVFNDDHTVYFTKPNTIDTFNYSLDKSNESLLLHFDAGFSSHKIQWNKRENEITIWNLFPSIPENPSVTTFAKK